MANVFSATALIPREANVATWISVHFKDNQPILVSFCREIYEEYGGYVHFSGNNHWKT